MSYGGVFLNLYITIIAIEALIIFALIAYILKSKNGNSQEFNNALQEILDGNYSHKIGIKGKIQTLYHNITSMLLDWISNILKTLLYIENNISRISES